MDEDGKHRKWTLLGPINGARDVLLFISHKTSSFNTKVINVFVIYETFLLGKLAVIGGSDAWESGGNAERVLNHSH